jgi:hypothetical protein
MLFLLAWLRLLSSAAGGPEVIEMHAPLPANIGVPWLYGMDIEEIPDARVRAQARAAAERHLRKMDRWNAKQSALGHLGRLAMDLRIRSADDDPAWEELYTAAVLAVELTLDGLGRKAILETLSRD